MCYNSECRIEIKSRADGFESTVKAIGKVKKSLDNLRFDYALDGDECTLIVYKSEVVQSRRGEQNIKMTFRKGERTECFLESGGFEGTFPVDTSDLRYGYGEDHREKQVFTLSLAYVLGEQKIELDFSAEYNL